MSESEQNQAEAERNGGDGCMRFGVNAIAVGWVILSTLAAQFFSWTIDEVQFEGGLLQIQSTHIIVSIVYGLALFIPLFLLSLFWKIETDRALYRSWSCAGLYVLALSVLGIADLTDAQTVNLLQILGSGFYIVLFMILRYRQRKPDFFMPTASGGWPIVVLAGGLLALPWLAWGAFGSLLDLLLSLISAGLFGIAAALTLSIYWEGTSQSETGRSASRWIGLGLGSGLTLAIMGTGLGTVGMRVLLPLVLLPLGLTLASFFYRLNGERKVSWKLAAVLISIAAAYPLVFVDPDELALVIGLGQGEIIQWAEWMAIASLGIHLVVCLMIPVLRRIIDSPRHRTVWVVAGSAWLVALGIYFLYGQPGFYGEQLFVVMKDQADVSQVASIANIDERRTTVYQTLVEHALSSQSDIRETLDRYGIDYTPYYLVNAIEVNASPLIRLWLESREDIDRILDNPILRPLPETPPASTGTEPAPDSPEWNLTMINANRVWNELGVTGEGVVVGQSDSGAQGNHPELADSYRGQNGDNRYNWYDPWNGSTSPTDIGGHGTHTLGTVIGNSVGVAPDAEWIGCVNLARNLGNPSYYLDCMQFMLAPFPQDGDPFTDGDPTQAADVLNNSWGCPEIEGCDPESLAPAVAALRAAGIFVVASAGNEGDFGCGTLSDPLAIYDQVYTVGAIDPGGDLASFSSKGPVVVDGSSRVKPDIVAPGAAILSSFPGNTYAILGGTSMAGPHIAGVVALMWSANPDLRGNIDQTEEILSETAVRYTGAVSSCATDGESPNNAVGWGVVDAYAAVKMALDQ